MQPGSSVGAVLSGLASLSSLECLTILMATPEGEASPGSSQLSLVRSIAGPATLRVLACSEDDWDWGDAALMQHLSTALPGLAYLDLRSEFAFMGGGEPPAEGRGRTRSNPEGLGHSGRV